MRRMHFVKKKLLIWFYTFFFFFFWLICFWSFNFIARIACHWTWFIRKIVSFRLLFRTIITYNYYYDYFRWFITIFLHFFSLQVSWKVAIEAFLIDEDLCRSCYWICNEENNANILQNDFNIKIDEMMSILNCFLFEFWLKKNS